MKVLPGILCKVIYQNLVWTPEAKKGLRLPEGEIVMYLETTIKKYDDINDIYLHWLLTSKGEKVFFEALMTWEEILEYPFYFKKVEMP
jgi:hypothetical protein